ncbi:MAG: DUF2127 domain-containing protein [Rhodanobacteraceae bacterium]
MPRFHARTALDKAFAIGIAIKAIDGFIELVGGASLLFLSPERLQSWAWIVFAPELNEDPNDFVATQVLHWAAHFNTGALLFAAIYLLSHGIAKLVVVIEILRGRLWAYPGLIMLSSLFVCYQSWRMWTEGPSFGLAILTVFDLAIIALTSLEYRKRRAQRA